MSPEEQFRLNVTESLSRIEAVVDAVAKRQDEVVQGQIALNNTVSAYGERISRVESTLSAMKGVGLGFVALIGAGIAVVVAFVTGD